MKKTVCDPRFLIGLVLRILFIGLASSSAVTQWYAPFLDNSLAHFTLDPWQNWIDHGGTPLAFPYGYVMWICFLPLGTLAHALGLPAALAYSVTLLLSDLALFWLLSQISGARHRLLLAAYWLSPIVLVATYLLGLNDLVPVTFLIGALWLFKRRRFFVAGVTLVAAISAKLSMVIALPFFLVYLLNNKPLRPLIRYFVHGVLAGTVVLLLPFFTLSRGGTAMLVQNPEVNKVFGLTLDFGTTFTVFLVPLAYTLVLYSAWRIRRINFDLFQAMFGLAFMVVVLMTPASPGWFVWLLPLLLTQRAMTDGIASALTMLFASLYAISSLLSLPPDALHFLGTPIHALQPQWLATAFAGRVPGLLHTVVMAVGVIVALRIWRETIVRSDFFRFSRKPFVLGVGGDSGAGKDTYAEAMLDLFGHQSVTALTGDDYHLWDRKKPMWQALTHLNPKANDLERFSDDLVSLIDGKTIHARHYDHATGKMTHPRRIRSNDFIIASGLHVFFLPNLRRCFDLSIFLDIDEDLRRYFKIERDVHQRGHTLEQVEASFARRASDTQRFIRPQAAHADVIFSLQPIHPRMLDDAARGDTLRFKLAVASRHGIRDMTLTRTLIGICGLHVDSVQHEDPSRTAFVIEGETSAADIALSASIVCPRILEFLDVTPKWRDGPAGLMQLITLTHINQALTNRIFKS
ncbi:uridine kinase [Robbsia sp. KACC 23696]|uniref:uridine kinase n=1 Tax=Robbsia sp. KACC 23696 TaxID=3149231 RepID=UPI00325BD4A7